VPEVAERDEPSGPHRDDHVIAGQGGLAFGSSPRLSQGVPDRRDAAERLVIEFVVMDGYDHSASRNGERASETSESRALRPRSSTGTKSIAYAVANRSIAILAWLPSRPTAVSVQSPLTV
jgi:hypothetical protein